jgi:hypothetical protein
MVIDLKQRAEEREACRRLLRDARRREWIERYGGPLLGGTFAFVLVATAYLPENPSLVLREAAVHVWKLPGFRLIPVRASAD